MASLWGGKKKLIRIRQNPSPTCQKSLLKCASQAIEKLSLFILHSSGVHGGMTVEAAIVLPLCLIFLMNLGCAIEMIRLHNNLQLALWDTGSRLAVYECGYNDSKAASLISAVYLRNRVTDYVGEEYLDSSPLVRGSAGLRFWESEMLENDRLDIKLTYSTGPLLSLVGFRDFCMTNRYCVHLWNGYDIPEQGEETELVYVAENGRVCHRNRECTHLLLSIRQISTDELERERNQWGSRYVPCEKCVEGQRPESLYVTTEGQCFHYREDCSGLKRTVRSLTPEEAKGYPYCSRCGGG